MPLIGSGREARCGDQRNPVHEPDADGAGIMPPDDIGLAVAVKIPGADDVPLERPRTDIRGGYKPRAVHQPDAGRSGGMAPQEIALAIAVEIRFAYQTPGARAGT